MTLGPWRPSDETAAADRVAAAFEAAGLDAEVATDVRRRLWEKLAINAAINPVTALARVANGAVAEPPLRVVAEAAAVEAAGVARAEGASLSDERAREAVVSVARATAQNRSSMHRDVARGRRTEVDAINGYVVERAADLGRSVPVNRTLAALLRGWEAGADARD